MNALANRWTRYALPTTATGKRVPDTVHHTATFPTVKRSGGSIVLGFGTSLAGLHYNLNLFNVDHVVCKHLRIPEP